MKKGITFLAISILIPFSNLFVNIYAGIKARKDLPIGQQEFQWKPPLIALTIAIIILSIYMSILGAAFAGVPECDSTEAKSTLTEIIESNFNLELFGLTKIKQSSFNEDREIRKCRATMVTNAGKERIKYKISWIKKDEATFFVELY